MSLRDFAAYSGATTRGNPLVLVRVPVFPGLRKCPRGGFRAVEYEFAVQNDVGQPPGPQIDEILRFQNFGKNTEKLCFLFSPSSSLGFHLDFRVCVSLGCFS